MCHFFFVFFITHSSSRRLQCIFLVLQKIKQQTASSVEQCILLSSYRCFHLAPCTLDYRKATLEMCHTKALCLASDLHQSLFDTSCSILVSYVLLESTAQWTDVPPTVLWDCFKWLFLEQMFSYLHFIFSIFYGLTADN